MGLNPDRDIRICQWRVLPWRGRGCRGRTNLFGLREVLSSDWIKARRKKSKQQPTDPAQCLWRIVNVDRIGIGLFRRSGFLGGLSSSKLEIRFFKRNRAIAFLIKANWHWLLIVPVAYEDPSPATYKEGQTDYATPIPADRLTKRGSRVNGLSKSSRFWQNNIPFLIWQEFSNGENQHHCARGLSC